MRFEGLPLAPIVAYKGRNWNREKERAKERWREGTGEYELEEDGVLEVGVGVERFAEKRLPRGRRWRDAPRHFLFPLRFWRKLFGECAKSPKETKNHFTDIGSTGN